MESQTPSQHEIDNVGSAMRLLALQNDDDSTEDNLSSEEKALRIHLIGEKIASFLDFKDLKNARLANKMLSRHASFEMIKRTTVLSFSVGFDTPENNKILKKLNGILEKREFFDDLTMIPFPCVNFQFDGLLNSPHVLKFFNLHGHGVKILELNFSLHKKPKSEIITNILQRTPNVMDLFLSSSVLQCHGTLSLPSLRIFTSRRYPSAATASAQSTLAYKILKGSPKLEKVQQVKLKNIEFFLMAHKFHLVKDLHLIDVRHENHENNMLKIQKLSDVNPSITMLSLKFLKTRFDEILQFNQNFATEVYKILNLTKDTLKELHTQAIGGFQNDQLPIFQALKSLKIYGDTYEDGRISSTPLMVQPHRIFPVGFNVEATFPNLSSVTLQWMDYKQVDTLFPQTDDLHFGNVRTLELYVQRKRRIPTEALQRFEELFPKLRTLKLYGYLIAGNLKDIFRIWEGLHLEHLEFHDVTQYDEDDDNFYKNYKRRKCVNWDLLCQVFTGLSMENMKQLELDPFRDRNVEDIRTEPSITNLIELKSFLYQTSVSALDRPKYQNCVRMSHRYAFNLMPGLQVTFKEYRYRNRLNHDPTVPL